MLQYKCFNPYTSTYILQYMRLIIHISINTLHISFFIRYFSMYYKCNRRLNPRSSQAYLLCSSNLALWLCSTYFNISKSLKNVFVQRLKSDLGDLPTFYPMFNEVYHGDKAAAA